MGRKRLAVWIVAGTFFALWAYSYVGMGPVDGDVQVGQRLVEEEQKIQTLLAQRDKRPEVDVFRVKNGRWVEIILTSGAADSLTSMDITSPPAVAKRRATSLVRDLRTSYGDFGTVQAVEVRFARRLTVDGVGVGQSARMIFDEDALRKRGN